MVFEKGSRLYRSRSIARLNFLANAVLLTCSVAAGAFLCVSRVAAAAPGPNQAQSQADVDAKTVQFMSGDASISAYLAKPKGEGKHAAVLVVHDIDGVDGSVQELTRRFAASGFVAFAPNLISRSADAKTREQVTSTISRLPLTQPISDLKAALAFLQQDPSVDTAKISVVGFGWGGWRAYKLAEDSPSLYKAVVFYGTTPADDPALTNIHASVLAHYAEYDFRVTGNAPWTEKQLGNRFKDYVYSGADRGFFFPRDPDAPYGFPGAGPEESANAAAAKLAWTRTLEFLKS
jgi:carboxymethylenebutenolidase